jgi:glutathione S-transferase
MILIGQYDSPFTRRVGIALTIYDLPFEHRPWSTFSDAEKLAFYNPLMRVPTLVLEDGFVLIDSHLILDYLDSRVAPEKALAPGLEPDRHKVLKGVALATGLSEKAVSLFYEMVLHEQRSPVWEARCRTQVAQVLAVLQAERAKVEGPHWFGDRISHADIALACALRHVAESMPQIVDLAEYPALAAHSAQYEAMPVFQTIQQAFIPPA